MSLISKLSAFGFIPELFDAERLQPGSLVQGRPWSFTECSKILQRCVGAMIIGLPRHQFSVEDRPVYMATEYAHIEGTLATDLEPPLLVLVEKEVSRRGMFAPGNEHFITSFPVNAGAEWTETPRFQNAFAIFIDRVRARLDIFFGYCGTSEGTARNIRSFIERELGATVLDWRTDFVEGQTIIEEIELAARRTSGGIFLFMRDDQLDSGNDLAAPRDNVVFEAGFFAHAKGRGRVLIIREEGAKMPADLDGSIYVKLTDRSNIGPLEPRLKRFLETAI